MWWRTWLSGRLEQVRKHVIFRVRLFRGLMLLLLLLLAWLIRDHHLLHHCNHALHLLKHSHLLSLIMLRIRISHHVSHHLLHLKQLLLLQYLHLLVIRGINLPWWYVLICILWLGHLEISYLLIGMHVEVRQMWIWSMGYRGNLWLMSCRHDFLMLILHPLLLLLLENKVRKGIFFGHCLRWNTWNKFRRLLLDRLRWETEISLLCLLNNRWASKHTTQVTY